MIEMKMLTAEQKKRHLEALKIRRPKFSVENDILNAVPQIIASYGGKVTVRQVFYKLLGMTGSNGKPILSNTSNQYTQMDKTLTKLREEGKLSFYSFEDRSREELGTKDIGFSNPNNFLTLAEKGFRESWKQFDRRMWEDQPNRLFILLEKATLSRVFENALSHYRIKIYVGHGYESGTKMKQLADECLPDKNNIVLHFSDYDPSGVHMTKDARDRLTNYGAKNLTVKRKALTPNLVKWAKNYFGYSLPFNPWKVKDPRSYKYPIMATELDALDPRDLRKIIIHSVRLEIDSSKWLVKKQQIDKERKILEKRLKNAIINIP